MNNETNESARSNGGVVKKRPQRHIRPEQRRVYESNGCLGKIKGSADKICEKYLAAAQDDKNNSDSVKQQILFQFAEHYTRLAAKPNYNKPSNEDNTNSNRRRKRSPKRWDNQPKVEPASTIEKEISKEVSAQKEVSAPDEVSSSDKAETTAPVETAKPITS